MADWIAISERTPGDKEKVLCFLPDNHQYLPGKTGETRHEPIVILRFVENFFPVGSMKWEKYGPNFWLGEGLSNHYFADVTHWMPLPECP